MLVKYLLDTDTSVYYLNGNKSVVDAINKVDQGKLAVSQITLAELQFRAFNSEQVERNLQRVNFFENSVAVIPLDSTITREYARQKALLRKADTPLDDFDLFIGATAITNDLILVTNNTRHFERIESLVIENWVVTP